MKLVLSYLFSNIEGLNLSLDKHTWLVEYHYEGPCEFILLKLLK